MSGTFAQQVRREIDKATARSTTTENLRQWSLAKPVRRPISPPQMLKLRDADIFILEDRCKGCNYCIEFCPKDVLEEDKKLNAIGVHPPRVKDSTLCVGCGVCEDVCPDFAIYLVDRVRHH